jgi:gluconokinase
MREMRALVVMGVAGSGKSSLAAALSQALQWRLIEGDDFHPQTNRDKMSHGVALTDDDRQGWLQTLGQQLRQQRQLQPQGAVLTCSALKRNYRDQLRGMYPSLGFVCLDITQADALLRVASRAGGHLFPPSLVASQFADFEPPQASSEPDVLHVPAMQALAVSQRQVQAWLSDTEVSA